VVFLRILSLQSLMNGGNSVLAPYFLSVSG
jgi:hypothetical protein